MPPSPLGSVSGQTPVTESRGPAAPHSVSQNRQPSWLQLCSWATACLTMFLIKNLNDKCAHWSTCNLDGSLSANSDDAWFTDTEGKGAPGGVMQTALPTAPHNPAAARGSPTFTRTCVCNHFPSAIEPYSEVEGVKKPQPSKVLIQILICLFGLTYFVPI